jgi:hypothetical protein
MTNLNLRKQKKQRHIEAINNLGAENDYITFQARIEYCNAHFILPKKHENCNINRLGFIGDKECDFTNKNRQNQLKLLSG